MLRALSVTLLSVLLLSAAESPWFGTWKLDPAQSTHSDAPSREKDMTITIRPADDHTIEVAFGGTRNDNTPVSMKYTVPIGGGPLTYTEGATPAGLTSISKRIDERSNIINTTLNGKEVAVNQVAISADGKTMTALTKAVDPEGKPISVKEVFTKQ